LFSTEISNIGKTLYANQLTPQNLIIEQLIKKITAFYRTRRFITVLTRAHKRLGLPSGCLSTASETTFCMQFTSPRCLLIIFLIIMIY